MTTRILRAAAVAAALTMITAGPAAGIPPGDWPLPPPNPPALAVTPSTNGSFVYGIVAVGQTVSQTFTLMNYGDSGSGAVTIALAGSAAFTLTADGCTGRALGPAKSCNVTVRYTPSGPGQTDGARLTATAARPGTGASIALTGAGRAVATVRHIYWTDFWNDAIVRADLDGANVERDFVTGAASSPYAIAVSDRYVYWSNLNGTIGRADLDGENANQSFITGASRPVGVAVDSTHIYWANSNSGTIGRADLDGRNINQSFVTGASFPQGVAVNSSHVYWTNGSSNSIGRAELGGGSPNQSFITGAQFPFGIAVDSSYVYWSNWDAGTVGRADLGGLSVTQTFITDVRSGTAGVAVDSGHVYWTNEYRGRIGRADLGGGNANPDFIDHGDSGLAGVAVDRG